MKKIFTFLSIAILFSFISKAQEGKISGIIKDASSKGIHSATVSLFKLKDSSLVKFAPTNKNGEYEFVNIADGKYFVSATNIGYRKTVSTPFEISSLNNKVIVPALVMNEQAKGLTNVTVTAKKPFIETKIDKTIVNVESSPTSAGATALEILEKSPGITVDNDGNISLRGKAGVIVMIDGKPTYLSSADLASLLKNMPASALDQIEIMTNPSAKYDASGNSGIINIKTKKGRANGFNGSIVAGITTSFFKPKGALYVIPKSQNSINFNYRKNKINFFGNYNPNFFSGRGNLAITRKFFDDYGNISGYSDIDTRFKFGNQNHTLKLGVDFFADKKNTYGVVVSGFTFHGHPTPVTINTLSDANHQPTSNLVSLTENRIHFNNFSSNFNYRHLFDTTGRELTVDLDYIGYRNTSNMLLTTEFYNAAGQQTFNPLFLKGHLPSDINIYSIKSDYTHPFKKGGRFEAGIKSSYVKNDNIVDYQRLSSDKWIPDARSNHFIYDENINAAYVNINKQIKKWSLQGGLRIENTIAKGFQVTNDSTFKRDFTNLFPSAFISYAINPKNSITVSYSRRITRPNYQDLNPFTYFLDSLSYRQGNPYLLPQFTHNIELSHSYKGKLITTLNYNNTTDVISQIFKQNSQTKIVYFTADNVAKFTNMGISITAPIPIAKWWNTNLFTNVYRNHYKGIYNGAPLDKAYTSFNANFSNTFTIKQGFSLELSGFYRAKGLDQLTISEPIYQMSLGGQKNILKNKATIRLNIRDPFAWQQYRGVIEYGNIYAKIRNKFDARQVTATFTYRFGKNNQQNPPPRRRNSATQDEQNRVGSAN
ncbi:MAG TPA: TonB-dependent receptor [Chitinophagaceae bacterium]|jgi:outer membrane receptor protein involved in Fe transport|nr:TonB-dependent receptor [Chitinophagaceae bacterium]